ASWKDHHEQSIREHRTQSRRLHGAGRDDHRELGKARVQKLGSQVGGADGLGSQAAVLPREPETRTRRRDRSAQRHAQEHHERIGANIMGKRMFEQGERAWPEAAPFHTPVYVLTHAKREPWVRPGGTTFYFINDG